MKRVLCIGMIALLACACGNRNDNATTTDTSAAPAATPGSVGTSGTSELITVIGCLQGSEGGAVGTSGSATTPAATESFMLVDTKASESGVPELGITSRYALDGSAELAQHANQQVSVTGRVTENALAGGVLSGGTVNERPRRIAVESVTMVAAKCPATVKK